MVPYSIDITVGELKRLVYNAKLYADRRSDGKGTTYWQYANLKLRVTSSDDFVILIDEAQVEGSFFSTEPTVREWAISLEELKELWEAIKDQPDDSVHVWYDPEGPLTPEGSIVKAYSGLVTQDFGPAPYIDNFAIWPDRFKKLALVKPGGAPLAFQWVTTDTLLPVLMFKAGKTAFGMIIPLDDKYLRESNEFEGMLWG